jgi:uncharacterized membrane protein
MNKLVNKALVIAFIAAAALPGCKTKSEQGGGAGSDTFRITVPTLATDVKQGELQTVRIVLERGDAFKQRVKLELKAPAGVQVEPGDATVQPGDKGDIQLKLSVAKDAPIGEQKILVKGTPDKGEPTNTEFRIIVSAK